MLRFSHAGPPSLVLILRVGPRGGLTTIEIKAFVPAKDFELSKSFYRDLGFTVAWSSDGLAYIRHGNTSFLLQEFRDGIDNFMMHLLVQDVDAWWAHVQDQGIVAKRSRS